MGYDRRDSFPFDFEPNGIPFGSKSYGKLSPRSYPIQFERKWNISFLSEMAHQYRAFILLFAILMHWYIPIGIMTMDRCAILVIIPVNIVILLGW